MREIPRAILLLPTSPPAQRSSARAVGSDSDSGIEETRGARRQREGTAFSVLTLIEARREDTAEIKGKQFRFRPYGSGGTALDGGARETEPPGEGVDADAVDGSVADVAVAVLDGFGAGARERNSSAFLASFIAQERSQQGLHNPRYAAASDAYRRAGASPMALDNQPRVVTFAV